MPWKRIANRLGIRPQHSRRVEGFCIVSGASHYIGLAARIQEAGLLVYGFGDKTTMVDFVAACDEFVYVDKEDGGE